MIKTVLTDKYSYLKRDFEAWELFPPKDCKFNQKVDIKMILMFSVSIYIRSEKSSFYEKWKLSVWIRDAHYTFTICARTSGSNSPSFLLFSLHGTLRSTGLYLALDLEKEDTSVRMFVRKSGRAAEE